MSFYVSLEDLQGAQNSTLKAIFLGESTNNGKANCSSTNSVSTETLDEEVMGVNKNPLCHEDFSPWEKVTEMDKEYFETPMSPIRLNTDMMGQGKAYGLMSRFPKIEDMPHFHYDLVEFNSPVMLRLYENQVTDKRRYQSETEEGIVMIHVECQGKSWVIKRCYEDFKGLDQRLHKCVFTRRFSQLEILPDLSNWETKPVSEDLRNILNCYLSKLSCIADQRMTCGPILNWLELDNHGNHLLLSDESAINVPALAAARVVRRYTAQVNDELSFEVDDMVSVIDMPPVEESLWWRGKHGFQVGFFPSNCVEVIGGDGPKSSHSSVQKIKPVAKKRGKVISFLRAFLSSRPSRARLMQRGILRERVFGCDLGEHLAKTKREIPLVLEMCTFIIENYGIVDGIYRLSGMTSNIQKLRLLFDSEQIPDLTKDCYLHDIHCISSLCKMYFRELPNPLLTFHLYDKFSEAIQLEDDNERIIAVHHVVQQLPPPNYRTLEFILRHLYGLSQYSSVTAMTVKNLAIVWAPNLLRCKSVDLQLLNVRIQAVVTEYLISNVNTFFDKDEAAIVIATNPRFSATFEKRFRERAKSVPNKETAFLSVGSPNKMRPISVAVSPTPKLISLEEARARCYTSPSLPTQDQKFIEVGGGPGALPAPYHTIVDLRTKKKHSNGTGGTRIARWRSLFTKRSGSTETPPRPAPRRGKLVRQLSGPQGYPCSSEQNHLHVHRDDDYSSEDLSTSEPAIRYVHSAGDFSPHIEETEHEIAALKRRSRVQSETIWYTQESVNENSQEPQPQESTGSSTPLLNSYKSIKQPQNAVFFVDSEESENSDNSPTESPESSPPGFTGQPYSPRRPHSLHEMRAKCINQSDTRTQRHSSPVFSVSIHSISEESKLSDKNKHENALSSDNAFVLTGTPITMIETSLQ